MTMIVSEYPTFTSTSTAYASTPLTAAEHTLASMANHTKNGGGKAIAQNLYPVAIQLYEITPGADILLLEFVQTVVVRRKNW